MTEKEKGIWQKGYTDPCFATAHMLFSAGTSRKRKDEDLCPFEFESEIARQLEAIKNGDLSNIEAMLYGQAMALQNLFHINFQKVCVSETVRELETYNTLALKAQNQCRNTLATLAEIKNPQRAMFIKQQNNAIAQQVNNAPLEPAAQLSLENLENSANELLNRSNHEALDIRRKAETISLNPQVEAMAKINRSKNSRRQD